MIDRKALWIFIAAFIAMMGADIWRLSLLPDWQHIPLSGPDSHDTRSALFLFTAPASMLSMMVTPFIQWLLAPEESLPSWRRWSGKWIVAWSVFWVLIQAFELAHSLGLVSQSNVGTARFGSVVIGTILMIVGNSTPKVPSPPHSNSSQPDSWRVNRMLRLTGKLLVGLGLAFVLGGILLPLEYWQPVFLCLMLAAVTAAIWYSIRLRNERSIATALGQSPQAR